MVEITDHHELQQTSKNIAAGHGKQIPGPPDVLQPCETEKDPMASFDSFANDPSALAICQARRLQY